VYRRYNSTAANVFPMQKLKHRAQRRTISRRPYLVQRYNVRSTPCFSLASAARPQLQILPSQKEVPHAVALPRCDTHIEPRDSATSPQHRRELSRCRSHSQRLGPVECSAAYPRPPWYSAARIEVPSPCRARRWRASAALGHKSVLTHSALTWSSAASASEHARPEPSASTFHCTNLPSLTTALKRFMRLLPSMPSASSTMSIAFANSAQRVGCVTRSVVAALGAQARRSTGRARVPREHARVCVPNSVPTQRLRQHAQKHAAQRAADLTTRGARQCADAPSVCTQPSARPQALQCCPSKSNRWHARRGAHPFACPRAS
jgi:hypothetical protein